MTGLTAHLSRSVARFMVLAMILLLPSLAIAGGADGSYKVIGASGVIRIDGVPRQLTAKAVRKICGAQDRTFKIGRNRLRFTAIDGEFLLSTFQDDLLSGDYDFMQSGWGRIHLKESEAGFEGKAAETVWISVFAWPNESANVHLRFSATVKEQDLVILATIKGKINRRKVDGTMRIDCKRTLSGADPVR